MVDKNKITLAFKEKDFFKTRPDKILSLNKEITPLLNELHNINHSERFWLRLLSLHLRSCIGQQPFLEQTETVPKIPLNTINSFNLITPKQIRTDYIMHIGRAFIYRTSAKELIKKLERHSNICSGARGQIISEHNNGVFIDSYYPLKELLSPDLKTRKRLKAIATSLPDTFVKNVLLSLPRIYVEYFKRLYNSISVQNASEKSFHYEHLGGTFMEYVLAKYQDAGSKVIAYQTGGFMGEVEGNPDAVYYTLIDELRTYGWQQNEKDIPDQAYRLIEYKNNWEKFNTRSSCKFDLLIVFSILNKVTSEHYDDFVEYFFRNIDKSKYPNLMVRPRPLSKYVNNKKEAHKLGIPTSIEVDDGKSSMAKTATDAKLVIQTWMPSTNFLECLSVNQAVVAVDTNNRPSAIYQKYAEGLYELGILHQNTESLVAFLNRLDSIDDWWSTVIQADSYKEFKQTFCGEY